MRREDFMPLVVLALLAIPFSYASAEAKRPAQAPTPPQAPPVTYKKFTSPCSSRCSCGCNEGKDCDCNVKARPAQAPSIPTPAATIQVPLPRQPQYQKFYAPFVLAGQGGNCGPTG